MQSVNDSIMNRITTTPKAKSGKVRSDAGTNMGRWMGHCRNWTKQRMGQVERKTEPLLAPDFVWVFFNNKHPAHTLYSDEADAAQGKQNHYRVTIVYNPNSNSGPQMGLSTQQDQHCLFNILEFHSLFHPCLLSVQHLSLHCQLLYLSSDNVFFLKQGASQEREVLVSRSIVCCCFSHCPLPLSCCLLWTGKWQEGWTS